MLELHKDVNADGLPTLGSYIPLRAREREDFSRINAIYTPSQGSALNEVVFSRSELDALLELCFDQYEGTSLVEEDEELFERFDLESRLGFWERNGRIHTKGFQYFTIDPVREYSGEKFLEQCGDAIELLEDLQGVEADALLSPVLDKAKAVVAEHLINYASLGLHFAHLSHGVEESYHERNYAGDGVSTGAVEAHASLDSVNVLTELLTLSTDIYRQVMINEEYDVIGAREQLAALCKQDFSFVDDVVQNTNSVNREREGLREAENYVHAATEVLDWFQRKYQDGEVTELTVLAPYFGGLSSSAMAYSVIKDYLESVGDKDFELDFQVVSEKKTKGVPKAERPLFEMYPGSLDLQGRTVLLVDDTVGTGQSKEMYRGFLEVAGAKEVYMSSVEGVNTDYAEESMATPVSFQGQGTGAIKDRIKELYEFQSGHRKCA